MNHNLYFLILLFFNALCAQSFNPQINKDSLFAEVLKQLPEDKKAEISQTYDESSDKSREFMLVMLSMPRSSKTKLLNNLDTNINQILSAKDQFIKLLSKGYEISIEFNPASIIASMPKSIDMTISKKGSETYQEWNMEYNSEKLKSMLIKVGWDENTLLVIKKLLDDANCISIGKNGNKITIGFARSGMGKYFYVFFNHDLTPKQIKEYNDGCNYIFYKKNIVLQYGGGAIGPQCFPD